MKHSIFRGAVSVYLMFAVTLVTAPLSATDLPVGSRMIGSVGAVGQVDLRGVAISGDGTLFSGDRVRVHEKSYAKVLVGAGTKLELFENSDVNIKQDGKEIKIAMNRGMVGFTANTPIRINLASFEVTGKDSASANVAITSPTTAGVRALSGDVAVRNLKTSESYRVTKGQTRLLFLKDSVSTTSIGEMASAVPGPVPAPAIPPSAKPATPARRGLSMDTGGWLALIGATAGGAVATTALVMANNNKNKIDGLNSAISAKDAAAAAQLTLVSNLAAIANTNAQLQSQMAATQALAGQAQLALANSNAADAAIASKISSDASASQVRLNSLASQISALQALLVTGQGSQTQLNALLQQEETERLASNKLAADLNALLLKNKSVSGVPQGTVGTVNPPVQASPSQPA